MSRKNEEKRKKGEHQPLSVGKADEVCVSINAVETIITRNAASIADVDIFASSVCNVHCVQSYNITIQFDEGTTIHVKEGTRVTWSMCPQESKEGDSSRTQPAAEKPAGTAAPEEEG